MAETKDFNTRYGDPTPITGEVLERLGFQNVSHFQNEKRFHIWPGLNIMFHAVAGGWSRATLVGPGGREIARSYSVGDLLRLCDSLGVQVREGSP